MNIPMDRAPVQFRHAAMRAVSTQQAAGRKATVSRVVAEKSPHGWRYTATIATRNHYGTPSRPETVELHCLEGPRPLTRNERFAMIERWNRRSTTSGSTSRTSARRAAAMDLDYLRSRIAHHERMRSPSVLVDTHTARSGGLRRDYTPRNEHERQMLRAGLPLLRGQAEYVTRDMHHEYTRGQWDALLRQVRATR